MLRATCKRFVKDDLPGVVFLSEKNSGETNFHSDEDVCTVYSALVSHYFPNAKIHKTDLLVSQEQTF